LKEMSVNFTMELHLRKRTSDVKDPAARAEVLIVMCGIFLK